MNAFPQPTQRMVVATAVVILPLITLALAAPSIRLLCLVSLVLVAVAALGDAWFAGRALRGWTIAGPAELRWFHRRPAEFVIEISRSLPAVPGWFYIPFPPAIETTREPVALISAATAYGIACKPVSRGSWEVKECLLRMESPWRLWTATSSLPLQTRVRIYPDLRGERAADFLISRSPSGMHHQRQLGKGREFEKLRDYLPGDSFEDVDWKASARRGRPVVKTFRIERTQEVYAIVDGSRLSARGEILERFVNAALILALAAESQGDKFGLATYSAGIDHFVPAARGKQHFGACREAIYEVQARAVTPDLAEILSFLHVRIRKRALLIFLTSLDDPALAESFAADIRVLSRRHLVLVNVPREPEIVPLFTGELPVSEAQTYRKLAGHLQWRRSEETRKTLERQGIRVAVVEPALLPQQIARQYLDVKQRQLL